VVVGLWVVVWGDMVVVQIGEGKLWWGVFDERHDGGAFAGRCCTCTYL